MGLENLNLSSISAHSYCNWPVVPYRDNKKTVENLVMSKYGLEFIRRSEKSKRRKSIRRNRSYCSISSGVYSEIDDKENNLLTLRSDNDSVGTENISDLISNYVNSVSYYNHEMSFVSRRRVIEEDSQFEVPAIDCHSQGHKTEPDLTQELDRLSENFMQTLKACHFDDLCRKSTNWMYSRARLEAEKLLVITMFKKRLLTDELRKDFYEEVTLTIGTINLKDLKLHHHRNPQSNSREYFFCILGHGLETFSSDITEPNRYGIVHFKGDFKFSKLSPDFKVDILIYSLRLVPVKFNCLNFARSDCNQSFKGEEFPIRSSMFRFWGQTQVKAGDFMQLRPKIKLCVNECKLAVEVSGAVNFDLKLSGFLDVSEEGKKIGGCLIWEKLFCILDGTNLKLSKYPDGEICFCIDLTKCQSTGVPLEEKCARKRSLELLNLDDAGEVAKVYFSADCKRDFDCWRAYLAAIVDVIHRWEGFGYSFN